VSKAGRERKREEKRENLTENERRECMCVRERKMGGGTKRERKKGEKKSSDIARG
jgi:hypothetical protein